MFCFRLLWRRLFDFCSAIAKAASPFQILMLFGVRSVLRPLDCRIDSKFRTTTTVVEPMTKSVRASSDLAGGSAHDRGTHRRVRRARRPDGSDALRCGTAQHKREEEGEFAPLSLETVGTTVGAAHRCRRCLTQSGGGYQGRSGPTAGMMPLPLPPVRSHWAGGTVGIYRFARFVLTVCRP